MKISHEVIIIRDEYIHFEEIIAALELKFNVEVTGYENSSDHQALIITKIIK